MFSVHLTSPVLIVGMACLRYNPESSHGVMLSGRPSRAWSSVRSFFVSTSHPSARGSYSARCVAFPPATISAPREDSASAFAALVHR